MLDVNGLAMLEDSLKEIFDSDLTAILSKLNRGGQLESFLEIIGYPELSPEYGNSYRPKSTGKILIVGGCSVDNTTIYKTAKALGISKNRLELCLDYKLASKYNYSKLQYNPDYPVILFGPIPHSGHEKDDYGSIIAAIENKEGYPKVVRLGSNELKITKSNLKEALNNLIKDGIIVSDIIC